MERGHSPARYRQISIFGFLDVFVGKAIFEGCSAEQKSECRIPRAERNPNSEVRTGRRSNHQNPGFCGRFRISVFELLSDFDLRYSDLAPTLLLHITNVEEAIFVGLLNI